MGDLHWPVIGGGINDDTNTAGSGTKEDSFALHTSGGGLAGNQRVKTGVVDYVPHLPHASGPNSALHDGEFTQGHKWTEADGKVHSGSGPNNLSW